MFTKRERENELKNKRNTHLYVSIVRMILIIMIILIIYNSSKTHCKNTPKRALIGFLSTLWICFRRVRSS